MEELRGEGVVVQKKKIQWVCLLLQSHFCSSAQMLLYILGEGIIVRKFQPLLSHNIYYI